MDERTLASIRFVQCQAASLLIYQSTFDGEIGRTFLALLEALLDAPKDGTGALLAYGRWFQALARKTVSWQTYLLGQIFAADNPFTEQVQHDRLEDLPLSLVAAARHDLQVLQTLYRFPSSQLCEWVQLASPIPISPISWDQSDRRWATTDTTQTRRKRQSQLQDKLQRLNNWENALPDLAAYYQEFGTGLFAEYRAFRWQSGQLAGISHPDPIGLADLAGYDIPKAKAIANTEFFLAGYRALNILFYGSRGSGKSSLVKALANEYADRGLRSIEVAKSSVIDLPEIVEQLRHQPQKFIIFIDDFSFEEDDDTYKALKAVLEGSLTERPPNVLVYATSNRRHLIREFFDDRPRPSDSDEVHAWDTMHEKLSCSDRFGLTLTFESADQQRYLEIIRHLAARAAIPLAPDELEHRAKTWATRHNGRSGRTARQFIDFLSAELALSGQTDGDGSSHPLLAGHSDLSSV
ncbi:MAG: ATP-binding protein [Cyanobacteriota bacterium]|nr:ATP-binding protein [Cyanobacteriota bacterium]